MTDRQRLPDRRACETFEFEVDNHHYTCSYACFDDGKLAELFLSNSKAGNDLSTAARDAAIVCSFALQYGVDLDAMRAALSRDSQGRPSGVLGAALDLIARQT
jgi:hypothetical protein